MDGGLREEEEKKKLEELALLQKEEDALIPILKGKFRLGQSIFSTLSLFFMCHDMDFYSYTAFWGMPRRDLLLRRYWRKDDDNTYVILYNSAIHKKCPPQNNFIRASIKSGGYLITPANQGKQSIMRYMLSVDCKSWRSQIISSSSRSMTINMLERVAGLRELFKAKSGSSNKFSSGDFIREIKVLESERKDGS